MYQKSAQFAFGLLLMSLPACGGDSRTHAQMPASQPTTREARAKPVKVIPWIEVNRGTDEEIDNAVRGLLVWRKITDTAIVSSEMGHAWIYPLILARVPGMHIIPGVKTTPHGVRFDSVDGWQELAGEVRRMCDATHENRIVIENEAALKRNGDEYWNAKIRLDFERLRLGLLRLPRGIEVWWYPAFVGGIEVQFRQTERLTRLVQNTLDVRFVSYELAGPPGKNTWWNDTLANLQDQIAKKPVIPIIYFYYENRFWPLDGVTEALRLVRGEDAIIYPGARDWVDAAENITRRLSKPPPGAK